MKKNKKILIIHGPNLDLLGKRESDIYGGVSLKQLNILLQEEAKKTGAILDIFQSNHEGDLVDKITSSLNKADFIIINPAAYTHTSVAIRDALLAVNIPTIEVHISNIFKREEFRQISFI